jgi:hypothetical protein
MAQAGVDRAEAVGKRARVEAIPNLELKGGLQQNGERLGSGLDVALVSTKPCSPTARAEVERARRELERVSLSLRSVSVTRLRIFIATTRMPR